MANEMEMKKKMPKNKVKPKKKKEKKRSEMNLNKIFLYLGMKFTSCSTYVSWAFNGCVLVVEEEENMRACYDQHAFLQSCISLT